MWSEKIEHAECNHNGMVVYNISYGEGITYVQADQTTYFVLTVVRNYIENKKQRHFPVSSSVIKSTQ